VLTAACGLRTEQFNNGRGNSARDDFNLKDKHVQYMQFLEFQELLQVLEFQNLVSCRTNPK